MTTDNRKKSLDQAMKDYGATGGYFSLADDKDTAKVLFLEDATTQEDLPWDVTHKYTLAGRERLVQCTQDELCPLCQAGNRGTIKLMLQLEDQRENPPQVKVWERGQTFIPLVMREIGQYGALSNRFYEVERNGVKGDQKTSYKLFAEPEEHGIEFDDMPAKIEIYGTLTSNFDSAKILKLDLDEMKKLAAGQLVVNAQNAGAGNGGNAGAGPRRERKSAEDVF